MSFSKKNRLVDCNEAVFLWIEKYKTVGSIVLIFVFEHNLVIDS
jgi:hypothetical protein